MFCEKDMKRSNIDTAIYRIQNPVSNVTKTMFS